MIFLLRLLRFAPVRAALLWLIRSPAARRAVRAGIRKVGRKRVLDLALKTLKL